MLLDHLPVALCRCGARVLSSPPERAALVLGFKERISPALPMASNAIPNGVSKTGRQPGGVSGAWAAVRMQILELTRSATGWYFVAPNARRIRMANAVSPWRVVERSVALCTDLGYGRDGRVRPVQVPPRIWLIA